MPGIRQRMVAAGIAYVPGGPPDHGFDNPSALITRLLLSYTAGSLSAVEVQKIAHAAVVDGIMHPEVYQVAALGCWGRYPGNIKRDLARLIECDYLPAPCILRVPCIDTKSTPHICMWDDMAVMQPHKWIAAIWKLPEAASILGHTEIETFWHNVRADDPRLLAKGGHPTLLVPNYARIFVPLWMHGDGVEYSENDSLMVYTAGGVLASTNSMLAMMYLASFVKSVTALMAKHGADTWITAFRVLTHSFRALWFGIHPILDWDDRPWPPGSEDARLAGTPICDGLRFCLWNLTGDLEYFANVLGMNHWQSHDLCWECNGSRVIPGRDWKINWAGRGWTLHNPALFHAVSRKAHPAFELPGVSSWSCCFDSLHVLDNKGVGAHLLGSALHQHAYDNPMGIPPPFALALVWRRIQAKYDEMHVENRLTMLSLSMLCNLASPHAEYPALHAKAADTRHLVPVMALVAIDLHDGTERSHHQIQSLRHLASFYDLCDDADMFMNQATSDACLEHMEGCLSHYCWLHFAAASDGRWLYNIVPKVHYAWHLAYNARFMNPRFKWTYKAESWIGKISDMGSSSAHGTRVTKITVPLADKCRLYSHVRLSRQVFED